MKTATVRTVKVKTLMSCQHSCTRCCVTDADNNLYEKFQDYHGLENNITKILFLAKCSLCFCIPHVHCCEDLVMVGLLVTWAAIGWFNPPCMNRVVCLCVRVCVNLGLSSSE